MCDGERGESGFHFPLKAAKGQLSHHHHDEHHIYIGENNDAICNSGNDHHILNDDHVIKSWRTMKSKIDLTSPCFG